MKKIVQKLDKAEEILLVTMFSIMVIVIFIQVIMRCIGHSLFWSEELGKFMFLWISWIGISIGEKRGEHIKITMLVDKFPARVGHILNIISELIVIAICVITVIYGVQLIITQAGTHYAGIKISVSWGYLSVVLGCTLMTLRSIATMMVSVKGLKTGEALNHNLISSDAEALMKEVEEIKGVKEEKGDENI